MDQGTSFSDGQQGNLRMENELLRLQLKSQFGDAFQLEQGNMSLQQENEFLKSMITFDAEYANAAYVTIYQRIGEPKCHSSDQMTTDELEVQVQALLTLLQENDIKLDIVDGPYPPGVIYNFITRELFLLKVEKEPIPGLITNFSYEEFHPNHRAEAIRRTRTFLSNWFNRNFTEYCTEISWHCVAPNGSQLTREDIVAKCNIFLHAFRAFKNHRYAVTNATFKLEEAGQRGTAVAEGILSYDAVIDNGEFIHYAGPFKLDLQLEDNWWSIFQFQIPGFRW